MRPIFSLHALRQRVLQGLLLCLLLLLTFRSQAEVINFVPQILGAGGGAVKIEAVFLQGFVPANKTVGVYDSTQTLIGSVTLNYESQVGLSIFYAASFYIPANANPYDVEYHVYSYYIGSAPLIVLHVTSPVILDVTTDRTLGAYGSSGARIYIKFRQDPNVPYISGFDGLRLKIENPDGTSTTLSEFENISSDSVSETDANYRGYPIPGNLTNAPQVYKLTASIAALPWLPSFDGGTITVNPSVSPVIQSVTTNRTLDAAGGNARIYIKFRHGTTDVPNFNGNQVLRLKIQKPDGTSTTLGAAYDQFYYDSGDSVSATYYIDTRYLLPANLTNAPQIYKLTASITTLPWLPDFDGGTITVLPAMANVGGALALDSMVPGAAPQSVTFTFRPADNTAPIIMTATVDATGLFSLAGIPRKPYQLHIKAAKFLAANVDIDTTNSDIPNIFAMLPAGDANNDNSCDSTDFGILIGAFNTQASDPSSGYDPTADFNGDGAVDSTDFGLLIGNFNMQGAP